MVDCLGLLLVGIGEHGSKCRHYSSREVGRERGGAVGCEDCRGPTLLSSFPLLPALLDPTTLWLSSVLLLFRRR